MIRKTINFAGESFEIEAEDLQNLYQKVCHFNEMNYRLKVASKGLDKSSLSNIRWSFRTDKDSNSYYEVRASLKCQGQWYPVTIRLSEYKPKTEAAERLYIQASSRWVTYDKDTEKNLQFNGAEFVPVEED